MKINYMKIVLFSVLILRNGIQKAQLLMKQNEAGYVTTKHGSSEEKSQNILSYCTSKSYCINL